MKGSGLIIIVASIIVEICGGTSLPPSSTEAAPLSVPLDTMSVEELVNYHMENSIFYFYPMAPLIKSEIEAILHLVDESALKYVSSNYAKSNVYQYIREYIVEILISLKQRDMGCDFHTEYITSMHAIHHLIDDTDDKELLVEFQKHVEILNTAIDWKRYYRNSEAVEREVEQACFYNGFEREYEELLAAKSC